MIVCRRQFIYSNLERKGLNRNELFIVIHFRSFFYPPLFLFDSCFFTLDLYYRKMSYNNYVEFIIVFTCSPCVNLYSSPFLFLCTTFFFRINCHIHFPIHFRSFFLSPLIYLTFVFLDLIFTIEKFLPQRKVEVLCFE